MDYPNWSLSVDPDETDLESKPFEEHRENYEDDLDWILCRKVGSKFNAAGGPERLEDAIRVFLLRATA